MCEKELLFVIKSGSEIIKKVNSSNILKETYKSTKECEKKICLVNNKLDSLLESTENNIIGKLKSANLLFEDLASSDAFTDSNIQIMKELYISNIGLPLDGMTGQYSNSSLVAYSYLGLIFLENYTTKNHILICRYVIRMFGANSIIAEKYFPEVYQSFFKPSIKMYESMQFDMLSKNKFQIDKSDKGYIEIGRLIEFYEVKIEIEDWKEGAKTKKEKLFGIFMNKTIGKVNISPSNCNKIFQSICFLCENNANYSLKAVSNLISCLVCTYILALFDKKKYVEKRQIEISRVLSGEYLECISNELLS